MEINIEKYLYDKGADYFSSFIIAKEDTTVGMIKEKLAKILKLDDVDSITLKIWNSYDLKDYAKSSQEKIHVNVYKVYVNEIRLNIDNLVEDYNLEDQIPFYITYGMIAEEVNVDPKFMKGFIDMSEDEFFELWNNDDMKACDIMEEFIETTRFKQIKENDFLIENFNKHYKA